MPDMLIRNVPDQVQDVLKRRAKESGMSVQGYVVQLLEEHTGRMTMAEWLDMVRPHRKFDHPIGAQAVREAREEEEQRLEERLREQFPEAFE
jgi:hypothetical protein